MDLGSNGVDVTTGRYRDPALPVGELARRIRRGPALPCLPEDRNQRHLPDGLPPGNLGAAGWGVVFAHEATAARKEALKPLLALRGRQAGKRYQEYEGGGGYRPKETAAEFLIRHEAGPSGPVDPRTMPYYLLLVGSPEEIPFDFQYALGMNRAVGRLDLEPEDCARYAGAVVAAESRTVSRARSLAFFAAENPDDIATALSSQHLVAPLASLLHRRQRQRRPHARWRVELCPPAEATRDQLLDRLRSEDGPAVLFTATHGVSLPPGDVRQRDLQGALLCADWPGPEQWQSPLDRRFYLAADDLGDDVQVAGLVSFHFACHGLGTPRWDYFADPEVGEPRELAPEAFVAALPRRLLARGALAVVGHVDRAWGFSFLWPGVGRQLAPFEQFFGRLLKGHPVGYAKEVFRRRAAELSFHLADCRQRERRGQRCPDEILADLWLASRDAAAYGVCGDPAVRLAMARE